MFGNGGTLADGAAWSPVSAALFGAMVYFLAGSLVHAVRASEGRAVFERPRGAFGVLYFALACAFCPVHALLDRLFVRGRRG